MREWFVHIDGLPRRSVITATNAYIALKKYFTSLDRETCVRHLQKVSSLRTNLSPLDGVQEINLVITTSQREPHSGGKCGWLVQNELLGMSWVIYEHFSDDAIRESFYNLTGDQLVECLLYIYGGVKTFSRLFSVYEPKRQKQLYIVRFDYDHKEVSVYTDTTAEAIQEAFTMLSVIETSNYISHPHILTGITVMEGQHAKETNDEDHTS